MITQKMVADVKKLMDKKTLTESMFDILSSNAGIAITLAITNCEIGDTLSDITKKANKKLEIIQTYNE